MGAACGSKREAPVGNDGVDTSKEAPTFVAKEAPAFIEGEYVKIWSTSRTSWMPGKIAKKFLDDGKDGEYKVTAGTYKVIVLEHFYKKYVSPEHLEDLLKVTPCASCRRPAAVVEGATCTHCCRTCGLTRGRAHGPKCDTAYEAPAPPEMSPEASQVPSEDAEAEPADILPDDTVQWMWGDAAMGFLGHSLAQQNPLSWSPWSPLGATIIDLAKVEVERRPVEMRTKRSLDNIQYFDTVEKALLALRKRAPTASPLRLDPPADEDVARKESKHEGHRCISPGCSRPAWNGKAGETCCRTCQANGGKQHGLDCDQKYEAASASPSRLDPHADEVMTRKESKHEGDHRCISPGCSRPTWNGKAGEVCRTCQTNGGKQHGLECDQKYEAASASPSRLDPHADEDMTRKESKHDGDHRCISPGCSRPTWNGKAGEVCCRTCRRKGSKQHGRECSKKYEAASASHSRSDPHADEDRTRKESKHDGDHRCISPGCSRPTWNGKAGETCCRTCRRKEGKEHGQECDQKYEAASASHSRSDPHADDDGYHCISPGCSRPTWNGKAGEVCCRTCQTNGGKQHGPECNKKYEATSASPSRRDSQPYRVFFE